MGRSVALDGAAPRAGVGAVLAAALLAIPLGIALFPNTRWRSAALRLAGLLRTIPSLALLAILISGSGVIGPVPAMLAPMLYALLPILSNTVAGLANIIAIAISAGGLGERIVTGLALNDRELCFELLERQVRRK